MNFYNQENATFGDEWVKAYSLIFDNYCARDVQVALKELPDYEAQVRDDPLELLKEAEKLSHVPRKAAYTVLALAETLIGLMTLKQGEKEGLMHYPERYKSERIVW